MLLKREYHLFSSLQNLNVTSLSLSLCVLFIYTILSVFVFHRAFHITSVSDLKIKDFVDLCKVDFLTFASYSFNLIETAAFST